nr:rifamycin-inactivating phosphotransferase [Kibdelosporangium sp. MJ126-NF4]CEL16812.1 Phosphoenolpyruvate synthase [Kibdelosporangium sp. MJ126-NF4]CTQ91959.1 Phosphoenolpyruvate synthase (EC 2.7.9.2) [Kibdelosporangium sp. MJ126-NF4]
MVVLGFQEIDQSQVALVGGKGANLGELSRIDGIPVPAGYCVTTDAFRRVMADVPSLEDRLDQLSHLAPDDRDAIAVLSAEVRSAVAGAPIPDDLAAAITRALAELDDEAAYAVRSSATAEDLPTASFAGQQDTYLNVVGAAAILEHIRLCWASLFTERAVAYRLRNGFDHRKVHMAVVVQQMVVPEASGILFTADPITSNRRITSVEASFGLGEALVSGLVNPDTYKVRDGEVVERTIASKLLAIHASPEGGTREQAIEPESRQQPALTDAQVVRLAQLGRRIEAHFGRPQDIEWCLADGGFQIVQSRPITTLFPVPETEDQDNHIYLSVGHQQMMTDPMKSLGLSVWQMTTPRPMAEAGGRLFVDVTEMVASQASRDGLLKAMESGDPLMEDALRTILDRSDFIPPPSQDNPGQPFLGGPTAPIETDPAIVDELIATSQASLAAARRDIQAYHGADLFDFIVEDFKELRRLLFDRRSHQVFMSAMDAALWINKQMHGWLGEDNAVDTLTQSVPNNITSEMGLALLDVADAIRPHPEVVAFLRDVKDEGFLDDLPKLTGGVEARDSILAYLGKYGMRCVGEIDITRPRWSERPSALIPVILGNVENFEPGASRRRFEQGQQEAWEKEQELLKRLRALPDGEGKAEETKAMIDRLRTYIGYREYPKYGMVSRYFIYKQAMLEEASRQVRAGVLRKAEDIFHLRFQELHDVVRTGQVDNQLIRRRKEAFAVYQALTPPRVLTSDGEAIAGSYRREDAPADALIGLAVSTGIVEGRARVILDMTEADLEADDILVTAYTDPSWSPLFVTIKGLVTEVGGLMTHGAVVAREYGLPAVVGVENATRLIRDGQRIRVNGTQGYVEILS